MHSDSSIQVHLKSTAQYEIIIGHHGYTVIVAINHKEPKQHSTRILIRTPPMSRDCLPKAGHAGSDSLVTYVNMAW